jgi:putative MATE family efflux protein
MSKAKLTQGNIKKQIVSLSIPMTFGMLGIMIFNLVDAYFIGQLGVDQLAAIGFTFPVVMLVGSISFGIGIAVSTILSKIIGEGAHDRAQRFTTDSLVFAFLTAAIIAVIGEFTIEPLFKILGAKETVLPHIVDYMKYWYLGIAFVTIPMVGNNAIRACGDTLLPGIIMTVSGLTNAILDPILIFGKFGAPEMGIAGAALATVISRAISLVVALLVLKYKYQLFGWAKFSLENLYKNWKELMFIGIPSAATKMIMPLGAGFITSILATYGKEAVAGYGIAIKVEGLSIVVLLAISSVISPFVGQNLGAGKFGRVEQSIKFSIQLSAIVSAITFIVLFLFGDALSALFVNENTNAAETAKVIQTSAMYLKIVPLSYVFMVLLQISGAIFNVLRKPVLAAAFTILQMFGLYVPLAFVAQKYFGISQNFMALGLSYLIAGVLSYIWMKSYLKTAKSDYEANMVSIGVTA